MAENKDGTEKTEDASAKRLQEAREKGQVSKSQDVTTGAMMLFGGLAVFFLGGTMIGKLRGFFSSSLSSAAQFNFTDANIQLYIVSIFKNLGEILLPVLLAITIIVLAAEISQVGLKLATKRWSEADNWLRPFKIGSGLKRIFFSSNSIIELLKGFAKIAALGGVAYYVIHSNLDKIIGIVEMPFTQVTQTMSDIGFEILTKVGAVYIIIAASDFFYQKWKFKQDMKMTKQEVKEETKQMEGDLQVKARLRSMGRQMLRKKMIAAVPKADVVVVNPTHFAVAISYKKDEGNAPIVVAKGVDFLAQKIREIATEHQIMILEDPPLARVLYKLVDIDQEIPEVLFKAVAAVLAYVYQIKAGKYVDYKPAEIDENEF
jgi:flagellar biosynthetic protein FlhB